MMKVEDCHNNNDNDNEEVDMARYMDPYQAYADACGVEPLDLTPRIELSHFRGSLQHELKPSADFPH